MLKNRSTSKNDKDTLDYNHFFHCSDQIKTQELRLCSNEASISTSTLSKIPHLLDFPQNLHRHSSQLKQESNYISDFYEKLTSMPKGQHKSKMRGLRNRRRSMVDGSVHNFNMDCYSIYQIPKSFFQCSNVKYSSLREEPYGSVSKWIEKKKKKWHEFSILREVS